MRTGPKRVNKKMKKPLTLIQIAILCTAVLPLLARAQQKSEPGFKLVQFHMGILRKGPKWTATDTQESASLHQDHVKYVTSLLEAGRAIVAGPLADDGEIRGVYIFRAQSADEARGWAEADPAVAAGHLVAEMHPWWAEDVMKKPSAPLKLTTVYLALLSRGAKWTAEKTPQTKELQTAHLANIKRLAELKKLIVAGPFGDNGSLAGIFVFRVDSLEEARDLAATDPAVKAGRLAIELHPWQVPDGIMP
jgi:uncharacterized protein YciI